MAESPYPSQARLVSALGLHGAPDATSYTDLFTLQLYPYASVYVGPEGMLGGEARDRVAGFWRALGLAPPPEPDHLCTLLALYANLVDAECLEEDGVRRAIGGRARRAFLWEHLLSWIFVYLAKLESIAAPFYCEWGTLLGAILNHEASTTEMSDQLQLQLPLHLRAAPPLADPRLEGADAFLSGLLAPVRSGIILVRDDLARAAQELHLGLRHGERPFVIKALLAQDRQATLSWLGREADAWARRHAAMSLAPTIIRAFWHSRAQATRALLVALIDDATATRSRYIDPYAYDPSNDADQTANADRDANGKLRT